MTLNSYNAVYEGGIPNANNQVVAQGSGGKDQLILYGTATVTGDGSNTVAVINWIDGTNTLNFTPSAVIVTRAGGNDTAAGLPYVSTAANSAGVTVTYTTAPANAKTSVLGFVVLP